jgi:tetraacyldisaccharide 4'-kinase
LALLTKLVDSIEAKVSFVWIDRLFLSGTSQLVAQAKPLWFTSWFECCSMRGYKAEKGTIGDEAMEHRCVFPDIPLVVQPDRATGLRELFATEAGSTIDCIVLDDGFQHRQIARDLDLVLIDATRPPDQDALLPHGYLREPTAALNRADAFVLTHTELVNDAEVDRISMFLKRETGQQILATTRHEWESVEIIKDGEIHDRGPDWLDEKRLIVLTGIGNPRAVLDAVKHYGGRVAEAIELKDHQVCTPEHVSRISNLSRRDHIDALLTTRKDWVKMEKFASQIECAIAIPRLRLGFSETETDLRELLVETVSKTRSC